MKKNALIFSLIYLSFLGTLPANDTVDVKTSITNVTVFFEGAQVYRSDKIRMKKGSNLFKLVNLPVQLNKPSIRIHKISDAKILSVKYFENSNSEKSNKYKGFVKEKEKLEAEIKKLKALSKVYESEQKLLSINSDFQRRGTSIKELKEAADYYRLRLTELSSKQLVLAAKEDSIDELIDDINQMLNKERVKQNKPTGEIFVLIDNQTAGVKKLELSYYIRSAGWKPTYDFRVKKLSEPLAIDYKANIFQSTGEAWKNVKLKLATVSPDLEVSGANLKRWDVTNKYSNHYAKASNGIGGIKGTVADLKTGEPLPFVNVVLKQGKDHVAGATSDFDGRYAIKPVPEGLYDLRAQSVGYQPHLTTDIRIKKDQMTFVDVDLQVTAVQLKEFAVQEYTVPLISKDNTTSGGTITRDEIRRMPSRRSRTYAETVGGVFNRGSRSDANYYFIDGVKVRGSSTLPQSAIEQVTVINSGTPAQFGSKTPNGGIVSISTIPYKARTNGRIINNAEVENILGSNKIKRNVTNLEYEIENPYTIMSDGSDHTVFIRESKIEANYIFSLIPKIRKEAFLIAELPQWEDLNLLSAVANIYYQGTYSGQTFINALQTIDTLEIGIGRDPNIIALRSKNEEVNDRRVMNNTIKETISWDIKVRNNHQEQVKVRLEDNHPLSFRKSIKISLNEGHGAKHESKTGKLVWELELPKGKEEERNYGYTIVYPRYSNISIE